MPGLLQWSFSYVKLRLENDCLLVSPIYIHEWLLRHHRVLFTGMTIFQLTAFSLPVIACLNILCTVRAGHYSLVGSRGGGWSFVDYWWPSE